MVKQAKIGKRRVHKAEAPKEEKPSNGPVVAEPLKK